MKQAILITAYTNIEHLISITESFSDRFKLYVHLDKKSKITKEDILILSKKKDVILVSQKYTINWGGINHLKAILLLLSKALEDTSLEYFHLITGHDYPIQTETAICSFLEDNKGSDFFEFVKLPYEKWENGGYDRILYYNLYDTVNGRNGWGKFFVKKLIALQKALNLKRSIPKNFPSELYGGSTYWSLSRQCVEYIFKYMKENPSFLKRFKHTFCSEEIFFQTIIMNSKLKSNAINNNKRFIVWEERNGNFPANLDESDFENIKNSDAFFARKFERQVSDSLLEKIKKHIE